MTESFFGAAQAEWKQAEQSGLAPWLLPVVSNIKLPISPRSKLQTPGKTPSRKNQSGQIAGIPEWTTAPAALPEDIARWSSDPDLGFCYRTGHDDTIAVDADINDPTLAQTVEDLLRDLCHIPAENFTKRHRNSPRWAVLLRLSGETPLAEIPRQKEVIHLAGGNNVEILTSGQQLALAGTHPSGERYQWTAGIRVIPVKAPDFNDFMRMLRNVFAEQETAPGRARSPRKKGASFRAEDTLASWLRSSGLVRSEGRNGELFITCPWCGEHSGESGETETAYFPIGSNGYTEGGFRCLHAHCAHRGLPEFLAWAKGQGYTQTVPEAYPDESPAAAPAADPCSPAGTIQPAGPSAADILLRFKNEKTGYIDACATSVSVAVAAPEIAGRELAYDTFRGRVVTRSSPRDVWEPFTEEDNLRLRVALEDYGFKPGRIPKDLIADAVKLAAAQHHVDTMAEYIAANIPAWDGIPRAERFLSAYCGAEDTEYTRAVGRYFWGMLYRRASSPEPIKADISLVLIGAQGAHKTRLIKALALRPEYHTELNFNLSAAELSMRMGGRVLAEFPEMVGFGKRKLEEIKAFLTIDADTYRPLYSSDQRTVTRRCLFVMTTNNTAFLSDRTGNRRYAPVEVGVFSADEIVPDIPQLWAEGREIFKEFGGLRLHRDVEKLTEVINESYVLPDSWEAAVGDWLQAQSNLPEGARAPLQSRTILQMALQFDDKQVRRDDLARLAEVMQSLGYRYGPVRHAGGVGKAWQKRGQNL